MAKPLTENTDEELLLLMQQGDPKPLTELYHRYGKKMIRYFHRMLWKDDQKARDFLQDLFMKLIEKPSRADEQRKFSTWIYSVAFNMCKNEYRKQSFRKNAGDQGSIEVHQPDPDHRDFIVTLERMLDESDEDFRNLFVLRYEMDMPISEIAAMLNCPEGTIKSRLFNLKKKLSQKLRAFDPAINN